MPESETNIFRAFDIFLWRGGRNCGGGQCLKTKTGPSLTEAFSTLLTDIRPVYLQTDKGTEFLNKHFQTQLRKNDLKFYTTENTDTKASVVERFNCPFKSKM